MEGVIGEGLNEGDRQVRQKRVVRGWCLSAKYDSVEKKRIGFKAERDGVLM